MKNLFRFCLVFILAPLTVSFSAEEHEGVGAVPIVENEELALQFSGIAPAVIAKYNGTYTVDEKGYLTLPRLKKKVLAKGKTTTQLEKLIVGIYAREKIHPELKLIIMKGA